MSKVPPAHLWMIHAIAADSDIEASELSAALSAQSTGNPMLIRFSIRAWRLNSRIYYAV